MARLLRWRLSRRVPWIDDVFHKVVVVSDVVRHRLQRLDEVPLTIDIDHTDLHAHIRKLVTTPVQEYGYIYYDDKSVLNATYDTSNTVL